MKTPKKAAQLTRAMTGHAPIGVYQARFKLHPTLPYYDGECPHCDVPQTRDHILSACRRYSSISLQTLFTQVDSIDLLADFLDKHPLAFSFAHVPYEPPSTLHSPTCPGGLQVKS